MTTKSFRYVSVLLAILLAGCATLLGPRQVEVPLASLEKALASRFPFNNRLLELLDITISNPRVTLQPETNRILTNLDAVIAPPFINRSYKGSFAISGNLRFDPSRNALVLGEPRVENVNVDGLDNRYGSQIGKIGSLLAEQVLKDMPLYTFRPEDLRYGGTDYLLSKITTRPNGLVVTFDPVK
ncbi:MAG TPA: DUF1439 domain-containing protein [Noviherbaspirillum sp.]|jgi:hypothetical protein|uniref:DUF1439 domain-containing protein n=1 Tax=Noviherbaspirillum sp. TaxID=1926288 RepID=UPI002DDCB864|nr:DUF1439 domain-containing protein [Noviherbaspirillum sp.]HEV2612482.1 DUF1439 domain-containing protein [Noviherbaspirillum sp.]